MSRTRRDELIALTKQFVGYETVYPPNGEQSLANAIHDRLVASELDYDIEIQEVESERPNVIARVGNPKRGTLLLTGHMDVVPANRANWSGDPFSLRQENGRLIGRGVSDMKASLAAMIVATEAYVTSSDDPGEVVLAFVIDEEGNQAGTQALVANGIEADAAVIGEPTELQIAIAEYGFICYTITVHGQSAHSGRPDRGINAIDGLRRLLDNIETLDKTVRTQRHRLFNPGGSISITEIEGGVAKNVIPDQARATITWRTLPSDAENSAEEYDAKLLKALDDPLINDESIGYDCERTQFFPAVEISPNAAIVKSMLDAVENCNLESELIGFHAGSDAVYLINDASIPTILFGPGSISEDAHTVDESIKLVDLETTADVYQSLLERYFE